MATAVQPASNAEPAPPLELAEQNLPAKSYVDAATEGLEETETHISYQGNGTMLRTTSQKRGKRQGGGKSGRSSMAVDTHTVRGDSDILVEEQFKRTTGQRLTTVKPADGLEEAMALDRGDAKRPRADGDGHELVSGRRAGAGWDSSG